MNRNAAMYVTAEIAQFVFTTKKSMKRGPITNLDSVHHLCNHYLMKLRSGSRRRSQGAVRSELRALRSQIAARMA